MAKRTTGPKPIFDVDALRRATGAKVFARGEDCHAGGLVDIFSLGASRVRARVVGTEPYMIDLAHEDGKLAGHCTCPAHRDFGFRRRMVAAALAANDVAADEPSTGNGIDAIRDVLHSLDQDKLTKLVLNFSETDSAVRRKLNLMASMASLADGDGKALARRVMSEKTSNQRTQR